MVQKRPGIIAFAGSARKGSYNKQLIKIAAAGAEKAGGEVTLIDLRDCPMPLFDEDLEAEQGLPEHAKRLKELFYSHKGLLIASPEYNSSITPLLKNTIDWLSRPYENEAPLACFKGHIASIMSASPGGFGGLRGLVPLRSLLENIGVVVLPDQVAVSAAHDAFNTDGSLKNATMHAGVEQLGASVVDYVQKLY